MEKHLVLVGGGHAHLTTLLNAEEFIRQGHRVTLISLSAYHYYSGMGPGLLSAIYRPDEVRFHIKKMIEDRGASFMQGEVVKIDPESRDLFLKSGEKITYDVVSFNINPSKGPPLRRSASGQFHKDKNISILGRYMVDDLPLVGIGDPFNRRRHYCLRSFKSWKLRHLGNMPTVKGILHQLMQTAHSIIFAFGFSVDL